MRSGAAQSIPVSAAPARVATAVSDTEPEEYVYFADTSCDAASFSSPERASFVHAHTCSAVPWRGACRTVLQTDQLRALQVSVCLAVPISDDERNVVSPARFAASGLVCQRCCPALPTGYSTLTRAPVRQKQVSRTPPVKRITAAHRTQRSMQLSAAFNESTS